MRITYAYFSNGDWMEMTRTGDEGRPDGDEEDPPTVFIIAVDVDDVEDLYSAAKYSEGDVLARLIIVDGKPTLMTEDDIYEDDSS